MAIVTWCNVVLLFLIVVVTGFNASSNNYTNNTRVAVHNGSTLVLNCSSLNGTVSWWFEHHRLTNNTAKLSEGVVQLSIKTVSKDEQGTYWCGLAWKQGYSVSVVVGDPPSPPQNVFATWPQWRLIVHWTDSKDTGGLPVEYEVWMKCLNASKLNCISTPWSWHRVCDDATINRIQGGRYSCDISRNVVVFDTVSVFVKAVNEIGTSRSKEMHLKKHALLSKIIPNPPPHLKATDLEERQGDVKLTWELEEKWHIFKMKYRIYYRKSHATINETWNGQAGQHYARITGLKADSDYIFFVSAQIVANERNHSVFGPAASVGYHTKSAAPSCPPTDVKCSPWVTSDEDFRNVTVSWKPIEKKCQNGRLLYYQITWSYSSDRLQQNISTKRVNASESQAVLFNVKKREAISMDVKACNVMNCSGIISRCTVQGTGPKENIKANDNTNLIIAASVVGSILVALIIVLTAVIRVRKQKKPRRLSIPDFKFEPYAYQYNRVTDVGSREEVFDRPEA